MTSTNNPANTTVVLGTIAGTLVLCLLLLAVVTHGSQGMFQINRPATEYAELLLQRASILRLDLGIDFLFIVIYAGFLISLPRTLNSWQSPRIIPAGFWVGALMITAFLDAAENAHIVSMLEQVQRGLAVAQSDITWQMAESEVKFMTNYLGAFLLSFALPTETKVERTLVFWLRWVYPPIGVAILVMPPESALPLLLLRVLSFAGGFYALAYIAYRRSVAAR